MLAYRYFLALSLVCLLAAVTAYALDNDDSPGTLLPTGKRITPLAVPHSTLQLLNPGLKDFPKFVAGQAMTTVIGPDSKTLLVLTSGYNRNSDPKGKQIDADSNEYIFVYDVASGWPKQTQVLQVPDSFAGIAFSHDGEHFYVSGGKDDNLHTYSRKGNKWQEDGKPVSLNHAAGLGFHATGDPLASGGVAVAPDGKTAIVANIYNDSLTFVDLVSRGLRAELDLRPGKSNPRDTGVAGGEYPFWITVTGNGDRVCLQPA